MMFTLASLELDQHWRQRKLQDNLPSLSKALGLTEFQYAQLASTLSACVKKACAADLSCSMTIAADNNALKITLLTKMPINSFSALDNFFHEVNITGVDGAYKLEMIRKLEHVKESTITGKVTELQELFSQKSREELMEEIQAKNLELEATVKERTKQLHEALESANAANAAKSSFLAAMSHEIRTPMNGVVGMIDLLRQTTLDRDQQQMTRTVRESAFSLLQIINDILDFSKIEAGKMSLEEIPFEIARTLEGVVDTLAPSADKKGIELLTYVDPRIPDLVRGDPVRLRQILFNIAGNAIKFTENTDEKRGMVIIRADLVDQSDFDPKLAKIRYSIQDNGIGIPKKAQASLFDPFTQAESSTTRRFGGTGLGLSICVKLCDLMGGEIGVESEFGKGSNFIVTLPHESLAPAASVDDTSAATLLGVKILLITGSAVLREFLSHYLSYWKAETEVASKPPDDDGMSTRLAQDSIPNVIIFGPDVQEARKNEIREAVRRNIAKGSVKFVFMRPGSKEGARLMSPDTVTVDSTPLKRSSFISAVAVAVGRESPEVQQVDEVKKVGGRRALSIEDAEARGELILVAEDNLTNQDVIRRQLNLLGYGAELKENGLEALEAWKSKHYALLLTDCNMPEMDGFELTKQIRESETETDRFPIIAITANALQGDAERCLAAGMDDYLSKPIDMHELETMLSKWMPVSEIAMGDDPVAEAEDSAELSAPQTTPGGSQEKAVASSALPVEDNALRALVGDDDEAILEILKDFVSPATDNVGGINAAFEVRSMDGIVENAHKLKSSARSIGANRLADVCETLEAAGKSNEMRTIEATFTDLAPAFDAVVKYIDSL